jgi:hypothetical protein
MSPTPDLDDRLSSAFHTAVDGVRPDAGSLDLIRRRGRAARRRRAGVLAGAGVLAVAVAAAALTVPGGGRSGDVATDGDGRPTPAPTTVPPAETVPPTAGSAADAVWPDPAAELFTDPVEATRSFLEVVMRVDDPPLSEFHAGEPGAGEVDVHGRGEDGSVLDRVASTVMVRQLDGVHWFVVGADSTDVRIDAPAPLAEVGLPVTVLGQGNGHEGTIVTELRSRSVDAPRLAVEPTIAGAAGEPLAFAIELTLDPDAVAPAATAAPAVLVVRNAPASDRDVPSFSARLVRVVAESPPGGSGEPAPTTVPDAPAYELPGQPLWPFRTQAEADAWLATADQGSSPWHADAAATAQFFTMNYLGFTEIDQIVEQDVRETEAWVKVGYESEPGRMSIAAVVHLVRFGPRPDAPWEVVGTTDDALTLDTPRYGTELPSSLVVGGTITGVDESIQVAVRQISSSEPLATWCCVPAGGERAMWETPVLDVSGATDPAVTVVAWSGGHVQEVEVFAITGLRP